MRYYDLYNVMSSVKITCFPAKRSTRNSPQKLSKTYIWHESRIQSSVIYKKLSCTYTQTIPTLLCLNLYLKDYHNYNIIPGNHQRSILTNS